MLKLPTSNIFEHIWTILSLECNLLITGYRYEVWMVGSTLQVGSAQDGRQGILGILYLGNN